MTTVAVALSMWAAGTARAAGPLEEVRRIPLEGVVGRIDHMAIDAGRLYVAALGNDSLEVVDLKDGRRVAGVKGLAKPQGVRVVSELGRVVVASGGDGVVKVLDRDLKEVGRVEGLADADNVRLGAGNVAYVGYGDGGIAAIDVGRVSVVGRVELDAHPEAFCVVGERILANVPEREQVEVIDRPGMKVAGRWKVAGARANFPMAVDEAGGRVFVGCRRPARVVVMDLNSGKELGGVDCCGDADDLFWDQKAKRLYVSGGEGKVSVIGDENGEWRVVAEVATREGARTSAWDAERRALYVAVPARKGAGAEVREYRVSDAAASAR